MTVPATTWKSKELIDQMQAVEDKINEFGAHQPKVVRVALAAVDTAGGVFAWANPEGESIIVTRLLLDITTKTTGACTLDCGVAANGTTLNDTLIDGLDANAATGLFDNVTNKGTNGLPQVKVTSTQYITGSVASGASAGIVGYAYITYIKVAAPTAVADLDLSNI
jgi:hypothetical protein